MKEKVFRFIAKDLTGASFKGGLLDNNLKGIKGVMVETYSTYEIGDFVWNSRHNELTLEVATSVAVCSTHLAGMKSLLETFTNSDWTRF